MKGNVVEKIDKTRFTIHFRPSGTNNHQLAIDTINAEVGSKATLIAKAICYYLTLHGESVVALSPSPKTKTVDGETAIANKGITRFTIRFNPTDPFQKKAMNTLNALGRKKGEFISEAIFEYLAWKESKAVASTPSIAHHQSYVMSNEVHHSYETKPTTEITETASLKPEDKALQEEAVLISETTSNDGNEMDIEDDEFIDDISFDDDIRQTILGGLSMFKSTG